MSLMEGEGSCPFKGVEVVLDQQYLQKVQNLENILGNAKQRGIILKEEGDLFKANGLWDDIAYLYSNLEQNTHDNAHTHISIIHGEIDKEAVAVVEKLLNDKECGAKEGTGARKNLKVELALICWVIGKHFYILQECLKTTVLKMKSSDRLSISGPSDKVNESEQLLKSLYAKEEETFASFSVDFEHSIQIAVRLKIIHYFEEFKTSMILVKGTSLHFLVDKHNCTEFVENISSKIESFQERVCMNIKEVLRSFCDASTSDQRQSSRNEVSTSFNDNAEFEAENECAKAPDIHAKKEDAGLSYRKLTGYPDQLDYVRHVCRRELEEFEENYDVLLDGTQIHNGHILIVSNNENQNGNLDEAEQKISEFLQRYHFDLKTDTIDLSGITEAHYEKVRPEIKQLAKEKKIRAKRDKVKNVLAVSGMDDISDFLWKVKSLLKPKSMPRKRVLVMSDQDDTDNTHKVLVDDRYNNFPRESNRIAEDSHAQKSRPYIADEKPMPLEFIHNLTRVHITVAVSDITKLKVTAIVNAANEHLNHGAGVALAISKAGGNKLENDCKKHIQTHGDLEVTHNCVTVSGDMKCDKVIHAVGPRWSELRSKVCLRELRETFRGIMITASLNSFKSVAIPSISSGIFGMPKVYVAEIMVSEIMDFLNSIDTDTLSLHHLHLVDIDHHMIYLIQLQLKQLLTSNTTLLKQISLEAAASGKNYDIVANDYVLPSRHQKVHRGASNDGQSDDRNANDHVLPSSHQTDGADFIFPNRYEGRKTSSGSKAQPDKDPKENDEDDICCICMCEITNPKTLECKHTFCGECIDRGMKVKPVCPVCGKIFGVLKGNQPQGTMKTYFGSSSLPGYDGCGTITIDYRINSGTQTAEHPNPGQKFKGTSRTAYLPNNEEGIKVLELLKKAWDARLIFTVGRSVTSGEDNVVTWNDIHHKTNKHGGSQGFGYPDSAYLNRVQEELAAKGIK